MTSPQTWQFHTLSVALPNGVRYEWTWRTVCAGEQPAGANRSFASLRECVADAERNGFRGDADPGLGFRVGDRRDAGMVVKQTDQLPSTSSAALT